MKDDTSRRSAALPLSVCHLSHTHMPISVKVKKVKFNGFCNNFENGDLYEKTISSTFKTNFIPYKKYLSLIFYVGTSDIECMSYRKDKNVPYIKSHSHLYSKRASEHLAGIMAYYIIIEYTLVKWNF